MKMVAYCIKCKDDKEHSVEKVLFFRKKIEIELDCGHIMAIWGTAATCE